MQTITDAELRNERDKFTKAYLEGDKATFTKIMQSHTKRLGITNKDAVHIGFNESSMARWKAGDQLPKEENLDALANVLFVHEKPRMLKKETTNEILINRIIAETGYAHGYEWETDFGVTIERITAAKRYNKPTKEMLTEKFRNALEAEWPDTSTIQDMLTEKPIDVDLLIEKLKDHIEEKIGHKIKGLNMYRLSEYLMSECRMPQMVYDETIRTINELPESVLADVPGYKKWRMDVLTKLWYGDNETAEKSFGKMITRNFVGKNAAECIYAVKTKLRNCKTRESGILRSIKDFDETCMKIYHNMSDNMQQKAFALRQRDAIIKRTRLFFKAGLYEQAKKEIVAIRHLPDDMNDMAAYAKLHDKPFMPSVIKDASRPSNKLTQAKLENAIASAETIFDYLEYWLRKNPEIKLKYN